MFNLRSTIGLTKPFWAALGIVLAACIIIRFAFAKGPTPQQEAAADIPVQQKIIQETFQAYQAYIAASDALETDIRCVQGTGKCPLDQE